MFLLLMSTGTGICYEDRTIETSDSCFAAAVLSTLATVVNGQAVLLSPWQDETIATSDLCLDPARVKRFWRVLAISSLARKKTHFPHIASASAAKDTYDVRVCACLLHTNVVETKTIVGDPLAARKLSKLEYRVMEALWAHGELSIREIQESFPAKHMPAYTTVQTTVYRMETKGVVKRVGKVGNFHIFSSAVSQQEAAKRLIDEFLDFFGGQSQLMMARLVESGRLSLADVRQAEKALERMTDGKGKK